MGKDLTEVRSSHRPLVPDGVGPGPHEPTFLRAIATKAKACQQHRFQDLYRYLDAEFLLYCWGDLNQEAASGVDGVTAAEYAKDLQANLQGLAERLKTKRYRAQRVRRVYIPKDNGTERPLGIPALEDKLVQLACANLLVAIYEQDLPFMQLRVPTRTWRIGCGAGAHLRLAIWGLWVCRGGRRPRLLR
jgi:hypothetical protein